VKIPSSHLYRAFKIPDDVIYFLPFRQFYTIIEMKLERASSLIVDYLEKARQ